jgi:hypothetical protein
MPTNEAYILLGGESVEGIKNYQHFIPSDSLLCSINDFFVYRKGIVDRDYDYIHFSSDMPAPGYIEMFIPKIAEYVDRTKCKIVTSEGKYQRGMKNIPTVIVCPTSCGKSKYPNEIEYNSLTALILYLVTIGINKFVLFGCDGYGAGGNGENLDSLYKRDADVMNGRFWEEVQFLGHGDIEVINVNDGESNVKCFNKISYEEFFGC